MSVRDFASLVRKEWGDEFFQPDGAYAFSNGRTFNDAGYRGGIYTIEVDDAQTVTVPNVGAVFQSTVFDDDVFKTEQPTTRRRSVRRSMNAGNVGTAQESIALGSGTVTLIRGKFITGALGSYAQTGIAAALPGKNSQLVASGATGAITGIDVNFYVNLGRAVPSEYSYGITGVDATLRKGNVNKGTLTADPATFTATPVDIGLTK
jgi:hypothetical protein